MFTLNGSYGCGKRKLWVGGNTVPPVTGQQTIQFHASSHRADNVNTGKPPNKGHFGDGPVVPCRVVVLFSEVFF